MSLNETLEKIMTINKSNNEIIEVSPDLKAKIAFAREIFKEIGDITEFNSHELMSISMLQNDIYLSQLISFYIANKKHVKRKHASEKLETSKNIASMISSHADNEIMLQNPNQIPNRRLFT